MDRDMAKSQRQATQTSSSSSTSLVPFSLQPQILNMKTAILACLLSSAAAFAPAQKVSKRLCGEILIVSRTQSTTIADAFRKRTESA
jgi:hypothetical protein